MASDATRTLETVGAGGPAAPGLRRSEKIGFLALIILAVCLRAWGLSHTPDYDEFYHILAAGSWLDKGSFCIADCLSPYNRGAGFTYLVVGAFAALGDSIVAARVPSLIAGVLLVLAVFVWTRSQVSLWAAWIAALLCAVAPELITWSQISRFYATQALLVWCGTAAAYVAVTDRPWGKKSVWLVVGASLCLLGAAHLQKISLIPAGAVLLWVTGWLISQRHSLSRPHRRLLWFVLGSAAAMVLIVVLWRPEPIRHYWFMYRDAANLIATSDRYDVFFYHSWFSRMYSYMYFLLPLAGIVALARRPRPAGFLLIVLAISIAGASFTGFKGARLILYALPFFFVIWAIALVEMIPALYRLVRTSLSDLTVLAGKSGAIKLVSTGSVAAALAFAALNVEAFQTTIRLLTVDDAHWTFRPWYRGHTDWAAVQPELQPLADSVDIVLSSASVKALYHFGRSDAEISKTQLYAFEGSLLPEFTPDPRLGRPIVSQPTSIEQIFSCYPRGLILVDLGHWRNPAVVDPEVADLIEARAVAIPGPKGTKTVVFRWETSRTGYNSAIRRPGS